MKNIIITLLATFAVAATVSAQEQIPTCPEKFFPNWQLGVKGGMGFTVGETNQPFKYLLSPAADLTVGYNFSPLFTLRADFTGWQGKAVILNAEMNNYRYNYVQGAVDAVFDFCNMFVPYKPHVVNPYIFVGAGGMVMFNNQADKAKLPEENTYWSGTTGNWVARAGLGVDFRCSDLIAVELEVTENMTGDKFNSKRGDVFDHQVQVLLGLKFSFGVSKKRAEYKAQCSAAEAAAAAAALAATAPSKPEEVAAPTTVAESAPAPAPVAVAPVVVYDADAALKDAMDAAKDDANNLYFIIGKYDIRSNQKAKIDNVTKILKDNPEAKVVICGFADKNTGSHEFNMTLSQKRANAVKDALVSAGILPERITTFFYGDTVQVSDVVEKNRVAVIVNK